MTLHRPDGVTESILVRAHPSLCEGWGECHRWAPAVYPLDDEGYIDIHVLEVPPELAQQAWDGARACPVGVISIVDVVRRELPTEEDEVSDVEVPELFTPELVDRPD
ncbi:MAG: ferredoxin [Acidimicrobiales bacterium]|nr:ferredoxin [Acidimicrobiales bacterium]